MNSLQKQIETYLQNEGYTEKEIEGILERFIHSVERVLYEPWESLSFELFLDLFTSQKEYYTR